MAALWGNNGNSVNVVMTEAHAQALVNALIDGVTSKDQSAFMEQYRRLVNTEAELVKANEELARKDQVIANQSAHIEQLNTFVQTLGSRPIHANSVPVVQTGYPAPIYTPPATYFPLAPAPNGTENA